MSIHTLENDNLIINISNVGAELISVFDKSNDSERMWNANPNIWNRHAPILFPFVGKLKNNTYTYKGQTYEMKTQHGFARDSEFKCVSISKTSVTHLLTSTDISKQSYPFDFELYVTHTIDDANPRLLHIQWNIKNTGNDVMLYSIGAHPGFKIPADSANGELRSDYYIQFPDKDKLIYLLLNPNNSLAITDTLHTLELDNSFLPIRDDLFDNDALVFDNGQIDKMLIVKPDKTPYITLNCKGFPYAGVWSKPNGQFICLEPWFGRTDDEKCTGVLEDKRGIQTLEVGCEKLYEHTIEFHK